MHFKYGFVTLPAEQTPAAILRYYRLRKGLTTRQLAESIGIVPATLLMYERENFSIPYKTANAMADLLKIDRNMIFDRYCKFIDYPYSKRLKDIRKIYDLNQQDFAQRAGIMWGIYSKWECGSRTPSRKMYQILLRTYPEIE